MRKKTRRRFDIAIQCRIAAAMTWIKAADFPGSDALPVSSETALPAGFEIRYNGFKRSLVSMSCEVSPYRKARRWGGVAALLLVYAMFLPRLAGAREPGKKFSKGEVLYLLLNSVPPERIAKLTLEFGISFELTGETEEELLRAGATPDLIETFRRLAPKPSEGSPALSASPLLWIQSSPGGAFVYVDDENVGTTSDEGQLKLAHLSPGTHRLRLSLAGYADFKRSVVLEPGNTDRVEISLVPRTSPQPSNDSPGAPQRPPRQKMPTQWKSRQEYDAYQAMIAEKDARQQISLAEAFVSNFPDSDLKDLAYARQAVAYTQLSEGGKALQAGNQALSLNPDNLEALRIVCYVFPYSYKTTETDSSAELDRIIERANHGLELLQGLSKPEKTTETEFNQSLKAARSIFYQAIGFARLKQKNFEAAIRYLELAQEDNPQDTATFYFLGQAYLYTTPQDYDDAIWYLARAVALARASNFPSTPALEKYFDQVYVIRHGSSDGESDIILRAAASVNPPPGFNIPPH